MPKVIPYPYKEIVFRDVSEYIWDNHIDVDSTDFDDLAGRLECADSVTGFGSGSYTMSRWNAEVCLAGNYQLLKDAAEAIDPEFNPLQSGPETADTLIRMHLVRQVLPAVIQEIQAEKSI